MLNSKIQNAHWEQKKRPQRILALEKQPQHKILCCGCFWTNTTRVGL